MKIVYEHSETEKEVIAEVFTNRTMDVGQALEIAGVNMEEYATERGWEGYDYNAIKLEV